MSEAQPSNSTSASTTATATPTPEPSSTASEEPTGPPIPYASQDGKEVGKHTRIYGDPKDSEPLTTTDQVVQVLNDVLLYRCKPKKIDGGVTSDMVSCGDQSSASCWSTSAEAVDHAVSLVEIYGSEDIDAAEFVLGNCRFLAPFDPSTGQELLNQLEAMRELRPVVITNISRYQR